MFQTTISYFHINVAKAFKVRNVAPFSFHIKLLLFFKKQAFENSFDKIIGHLSCFKILQMMKTFFSRAMSDVRPLFRLLLWYFLKLLKIRNTISLKLSEFSFKDNSINLLSMDLFHSFPEAIFKQRHLKISR